jgi:D-alanyl-D-alanine carboxypeptidase (penicillin-binding protein 5/6)
MTALVALEHGNLEQRVVISEKAASVGENAMGISAGESYSLKELLYGMLLNSGNDAATAIAEGTAGNEEMFVRWMNIKATEIGLTNTYFADPSGLNDASYSTAEDLVTLTHFALKHDEFRNAVKTVEEEYPYSDAHKYIYLSNQTNLLTTYPGVLGVKTGYTEEAGLCLVTYAVNEGRELIGVVLNSVDRKGDMIRMLDSSFSGLGVNVEHNLLD